MVGACVSLVWPLAKRGVWNAQIQLMTVICISVHSSGYGDWMSWALPFSFCVAERLRCRSNHSTKALSSACRVTELLQSRSCVPLDRNSLLSSGLGELGA